jgi:citrate synthase
MPAFCRRATPGGGAGTLTLIDNRTGKRYEVAISDHGSIKATDLKQVTAGGDGVGLRTYDNGYVNTVACRSRVSYIDGDAGILRYRGYPIEQLAERSNFLEVSYLVVYGSLPTPSQMQRWSEAVMRHSALPVAVEQTIAALPHDAHPMGTILTGLCALSTLHPEQVCVWEGCGRSQKKQWAPACRKGRAAPAPLSPCSPTRL